jgi:hypothetical protein
MYKLFLKMVLGLIIIVTNPITVIPSVMLLAITNRLYIMELFEWCIYYED